MADNIELNVGLGGDTYAADEISGVKYGRSKITLGDDGENAGDVSADNPMPVTVDDEYILPTNEVLNKILKELKLLNMRIEIAFEAGIDNEDI